jgi:hypothetical protein
MSQQLNITCQQIKILTEVLIMQSNYYQNCNKLIMYNNDPYLFGVLVNLLKMNTLP